MNSRLKDITASIVPGLLLGMASPCSADLSQLLGFSLEELSNTEISIASKTQQKIKDAPASVTIFTRAEIRAMEVQTVEQLMNFVPGFQAMRETVLGDGLVVAGRGQSTPQASFNFLFLIDGQRLNAELSGGALDFNRFISLFNVKQVEIIRGPGSVLYGDSAYTGVINIVTESERREVAVYKGTIAGDAYHFNINTEFDNSKLSLSGRHYSDKGGSYGDELSRYVFSTPITLNDPRTSDEFYAQYQWQETIKVNFRRTSSMVSFSSDKIVGAPIFSSRQEHDSLFLKATLLNNARWRVLLSAGKVAGERKAFVLMPDITSGARVDNTLSSEDGMHFDMNVHYGFTAAHRLLLGYEWREGRNAKVENFSDLLPTDGRLMLVGENIPESNRKLSGLYIQDQYKINEQLSISAGVRYDDYFHLGNATSPRLAIIATTRNQNIFKLIYSEAFRAPSLRQLRSLAVGNPSLVAETSQTSELIWMRQFDNVHVSATYFHSEYMNKITTIPRSDPLDPRARIFANIGSETASGFELETTARLGDFTLRGAYANVQTDESPRFTVEQSLSFALNYSINNWNINLNGYYGGDVEQASLIAGGSSGVEINVIEARDVWNITARYSRQTSRWDFVMRIDNILDEKYYSPTRLTNITDGLPSRGRLFWTGVEVEF